MKIHLLGIGGVGMSALATVLKLAGHEISGADRNLATGNIRRLRELGVAVYPDDGSGVDGSLDEIVVSTAIEADNPALVRARELGIPVIHRAAALAEALRGRRLVAVAGTCGKSTVTAMLGHILAECGFDPFCVDGANVPGWIGAVRAGNGAYAVAEVDESDKSLTAFSPYAAIVTNASADHYSAEEMNEVFDEFIRDLPGPIIDGRHESGECAVSMPGVHNRRNAYLAWRMAVALGADSECARRALMSFCGVERRLQRYGENVFDDYAHNPEKLAAFWTTLAADHPEGICVIWRPHGYAPLRKMRAALAETFRRLLRPVDALLLLDVYDAGGTAVRDLNSCDLAADLNGASGVVECVHDAAGALAFTARQRRFGAYGVCGARDPALPHLAAELARTVSAHER